MSDFDPSFLLDVPPYPREGYATLADRLAAILRTRNDVLLVQGEAIIALEAAATSIARPKMRALNVVTSPYGRLFGLWLERSGAEVAHLVAQPGLPVTVEALTGALQARPETNLVALAHAESATGILNPLPEIARLARRQGALLVVDAVASVGGHALDVDELGIDIAVIGPQKSLGGPSGLSALSVSSRAWEAIMRPDAPVASILSLADLRLNWLDSGRGELPGMPSPLEFHALEVALDRVEAEGLDALIARHTLAAQATRDGLAALGLPSWVEDRDASNLVTAALLPAGLSADAVVRHPAAIAAGLDKGVGDLPRDPVRLNHTGPRARHEVVRANLSALGQALRECGVSVDVAAAVAAVDVHYRDRAAGMRLV
ncbi:aminotransferase class V-fold PLP-dependent enzyme [Chelativorans sp. AA-79]|uniref:pyridoxal-phosphate-dependent aminotransferase family protein n=1 Tax=Chelativorans sp. AA-79 TaxID=3028735 RepID=UPI0023F66F12|nr:aminotransferase class V-fold PLP-dependent enzyme [Chelativorans sp. AA-79]WEX10455.1 aminotransferase class V-fold PLP-dependent enzyme [Chelativorans sp. AA-79]